MGMAECVVYYGLQFEISPTEIDDVDEGTDKRIIAANTVNLQHYWSEFGSLDNQYFLFIGHEIGVMGTECKSEVQLTSEEFDAIVKSTCTKLKLAGFEQSPQLRFQWLEEHLRWPE